MTLADYAAAAGVTVEQLHAAAAGALQSDEALDAVAALVSAELEAAA